MKLSCVGLTWTPSKPKDGVTAELINLGNGTYIDYEDFIDYELRKDKIQTVSLRGDENFRSWSSTRG